MEMILARHGNTFRTGQPVVWVGSQNDLPLVESGIDQATLLGQTLFAKKTSLTAVYTGPLQRMTSYANIILNEMKLELQPVIDMRINEIDYGKWSGLTSKEVCERFGMDEFENWEKHSTWSQKGEWGESAHLVAERIKQFANDLIKTHQVNEKVLIVGSNGCLRYFLDLIPGQLQHHIENQTAKIATGNISKLSYDHGAWQLDYWNISPKQID